ncbi:MAG: hypothetical protein CUN54_09995, partial [Phototrophicales bacterium]
KQIQHLDFTTYFRVRGGFENSERYIEFQDQLIAWTTQDVANAIRTAPEWDDMWTSNDWLDRHEDIPPPPDIDIDPPSLAE